MNPKTERRRARKLARQHHQAFTQDEPCLMDNFWVDCSKAAESLKDGESVTLQKYLVVVTRQGDQWIAEDLTEEDPDKIPGAAAWYI